ncbi:MAG TPA: potassium transporter TrkG [Steroidobacteraceae bacterium]|jgi:trk system potassium uptake protein|nr:potassium transporter TrkG [Steroidobacteraceae bacterium]
MLGVIHVLGLMLAAFGATYSLPVLAALISQDGTASEFIASALISTGIGVALAAATRRHARELKPRDGFLLVTVGWLLMSASAAIPLLLLLPHLSFTRAFFEAMSGLTTTGSTVLRGLDTLPPSINLWRATLHWCGGLGIIVLAVAVLPFLGVGGMQLYKAEAPGPVKDEKLTPRITETAKSLWFAYTAITAVGIVALRICGMSWFDAICHCFSAVGLGGFSTHDASIAYFNSPAIELTLNALMIVASLSFARHFVALRRLSLKPYTRDPEAKAILLVLSVSVVGIAVLLWYRHVYPTFGTALRHAAFNVISIATTSGLTSQDYTQWPVFAPLWMLFLCCIVCSTGSAGGGIKMFRTLLLSQQARRELKLLVHPSAVAPVRIGGRTIPERVCNSVLAFIFLYFMTAAALTFALLATGLDFDTSFGAVVASINNTGPGLGSVGPGKTYQSLTVLQTWICTAAMLLGRLEIFSVLVLFTPAFWRK